MRHKLLFIEIKVQIDEEEKSYFPTELNLFHDDNNKGQYLYVRKN